MVSAANLELLLGAADEDGDGQINYAEFCRLIWADDIDSMRADIRIDH